MFWNYGLCKYCNMKNKCIINKSFFINTLHWENYYWYVVRLKMIFKHDNNQKCGGDILFNNTLSFSRAKKYSTLYCQCEY